MQICSQISKMYACRSAVQQHYGGRLVSPRVTSRVSRICVSLACPVYVHSLMQPFRRAGQIITCTSAPAISCCLLCLSRM